MFVATNMCLSRQNKSFVATKVCLLRQNFCCIFFFCRDKHTFVATKGVFCRDKHVFVTTKRLSRQKYLWQLPPIILLMAV